MKQRKLGFGRKIVLGLVVVAAGAGSIFWWKQTAQEREIKRLRQAIENLTATYPIARLVVEKETTDEAGVTRAHLRVTLVDDEGRECGAPTEAVIEGKRIYFEALVITFDERLVGEGKARAMAFPTRLFSERVAPEDGVALDVLNDEGVPILYDSHERDSGSLTADQYRRILKRFWYYANHVNEAESLGIKVIQGKAVFTKYELRRYYSVYMQANGSLDIVPEKFWLNGDSKAGHGSP